MFADFGFIESVERARMWVIPPYIPRLFVLTFTVCATFLKSKVKSDSFCCFMFGSYFLCSTTHLQIKVALVDL